ncbi:RNA-directed DNA polymerase, eukaryota, partial [Tanacetum coccineum]
MTYGRIWIGQPYTESGPRKTKELIDDLRSHDDEKHLLTLRNHSTRGRYKYLRNSAGTEDPRNIPASINTLEPTQIQAPFNDAKFVNDFWPISLIECVYKVITKVLANRLATVISDLVSETQSAFVANRQILDGPFILNEMLNWCKRKKKQAMFGFGPNWCRWIRCTFTSSMASILVNGSPTSEFPFCCGLKQGDPLAPYLFILIMESLHISFSRVVDDGLFKGFQLHGSVNISHLFYADDAMFIGEWSEQNLHNIVKVLNCFHLASGLKINIAKSQVLGVGVSQNVV